MSGLVLRLKQPPRQRIDMSPLSPPRLAGLDQRQIAAIELLLGNQMASAGDIFAIEFGDPRALRIAESCDKLDFIGRGLADGRIAVEGDAGAYLGLAMTGGRISVSGNAWIYGGAGMSGGRIDISGDAGDHLGGALPGERFGLRGGTVKVRGHAGHRLGDRMRRGLIMVEGAIGDYAASRMIAGTIIGLGDRIGVNPGFAMKRGSFISRRAPDGLLPGFADCGRPDYGFAGLLVRTLRNEFPSIETYLPMTGHIRRFAGDLANDGNGELLFWS
jgi:formylmethanofuran dehydrogenase subunit C